MITSEHERRKVLAKQKAERIIRDIRYKTDWRTAIMDKINYPEQQKAKEDRKYWENNYDPVFDPRLDDEGTYDYYATYKPKNDEEWYWNRPFGYKRKCDGCGKRRRLYSVAYEYFYTTDGYDYFDDALCWECQLKGNIAYRKACRKVAKEAKND